jgi:putative RNA 2'-phosphotransferase
VTRTTRLSKLLAYVLRHRPWEYELELGCEGWVDVGRLMDALRRDPEWRDMADDDLREMFRRATRDRYELAGGRIRARYGHSVTLTGIPAPAEPPDLLFHGTARGSVPAIRRDGLLPQGRQYVHLAVDPAVAAEVGRRTDRRPVVLAVDARAAWSEGCAFYPASADIVLADAVPARYVRDLEAPATAP